MERLAGRVRNLGLLAVSAGIVGEYCMYDVDAGNRVVIFDSLKGVLPGIYGEGTRFKWPWQVSVDDAQVLFWSGLLFAANANLEYYFDEI